MALPDILQSNVSTASFYDATGLQTSPGGERASHELAKVSLWDLRNTLKAAAGSAPAGGPVLVTSDTVQSVFDIMHEVRQHNRLQRALRREARAAYGRVEALQRDNARLSAQLKTVTAAAATISPTDSTRDAAEGGSRPFNPDGPKTPPPFWPTTGVLPFASSAGPASAALRSGGAASSLDGRSHKSDGLTGDEVEALHGRPDERKQLKQCDSHFLPLSFAIIVKLFAHDGRIKALIATHLFPTCVLLAWLVALGAEGSKPMSTSTPTCF